jgi:CO/xanthine dehydrogenase Mo-binding subunit
MGTAGDGRPAYAVIGQPLPKVDAWSKVTGATLFADDLVVPRMAFAKILRAQHPHALIRGIDTSRARAVPGVYAVITGRDFAPVRFGIMPVSQDEEPLCVDKVRFVGDPLAAVAAVDEATAERAMHLIDVDYAPLSPLMTIEAALAEGSHRIHEYGDGHNIHKLVSLEFGDVEEGFREADLVREDAFFFEGNTHLPMEQHAALAQWTPDGKLTLWSSTQTPHYVHRALGKVLQLPLSHVRVIATPNGGGFGGKSDPFSHEMVVARLAQLTGRPVKTTLTREEVFYTHRGRHPVLMWLKSGVRRDGEILALQFRTWLDGGAYGSYGVARPSTPGPCRPSPTRSLATSSRGAASSPTSRPAAPSVATAPPSRASPWRSTSTASRSSSASTPRICVVATPWTSTPGPSTT